MANTAFKNRFSCRLPMSTSPGKFRRPLISHQDMSADQSERWRASQHDIPLRCGVLKDIDLLDVQYFDIHSKQANCMDPQMRLLLEDSHNA